MFRRIPFKRDFSVFFSQLRGQSVYFMHFRCSHGLQTSNFLSFYVHLSLETPNPQPWSHVFTTIELFSLESAVVDDWRLISGRRKFDTCTCNIWVVGDSKLTCGRMILLCEREEIDVLRNVIWHVDEWKLTPGACQSNPQALCGLVQYIVFQANSTLKKSWWWLKMINTWS